MDTDDDDFPDSSTSTVETDPNWGREMDTDDEESLDDADVDPDFKDVNGPFSRMIRISDL